MPDSEAHCEEGAYYFTHWPTNFHISLASLMDFIVFYQPPLNDLSSSSAASRFQACREAAIAPDRIPRLGMTLGPPSTLTALQTFRGQLVPRSVNTALLQQW